MDDLQKQLFNLAVIHGLKKCYSTLDSLRNTIKLHGQFLMEEFNTDIHSTEVNVIEENVQRVETENSEVKMEDSMVAKEPVIDKPVRVRKTKKKETVEGEEVSKGNAKKRWQREQEALKRLELNSKGIFKQDVLTLENVKSWLSSGYTYASIARLEVGCTEEEVSRFCKKHKLNV